MNDWTEERLKDRRSRFERALENLVEPTTEGKVKCKHCGYLYEEKADVEDLLGEHAEKARCERAEVLDDTLFRLREVERRLKEKKATA